MLSSLLRRGAVACLDPLIAGLERLRLRWSGSQDKSTQPVAGRQPISQKNVAPRRVARESRRPIISPLHLGHCCPVHGCYYEEQDCPVYVAKAEPYFAGNNGCPQCS